MPCYTSVGGQAVCKAGVAYSCCRLSSVDLLVLDGMRWVHAWPSDSCYRPTTNWNADTKQNNGLRRDPVSYLYLKRFDNLHVAVENLARVKLQLMLRKGNYLEASLHLSVQQLVLVVMCTKH